MSGSGHIHSTVLAVTAAKTFFQAVTKSSNNVDDILPQEDGETRLSVYTLFSELFPEFVKVRNVSHPATNTNLPASSSNGLTRLQFNKIGYELYVKEQSRRVPSPHAKPGNPGYGFRQAKWRNTTEDIQDRIQMFELLSSIGISSARCEYIRERVEEFRRLWDLERRPCRCAGPGRPKTPRGAQSIQPMDHVNEEGLCYTAHHVPSPRNEIDAAPPSESGCCARDRLPPIEVRFGSTGAAGLLGAHHGSARHADKSARRGAESLGVNEPPLVLAQAGRRSASPPADTVVPAIPPGPHVAAQRGEAASTSPSAMTWPRESGRREEHERAGKRAREMEQDNGGRGASPTAGPVNKASLAHLLS